MDIEHNLSTEGMDIRLKFIPSTMVFDTPFVSGCVSEILEKTVKAESKGECLVLVPEKVVERVYLAEKEKKKIQVRLRECQFELERERREFNLGKSHLEYKVKTAEKNSSWLSKQVQSLKDELNETISECGLAKRASEDSRATLQRVSTLEFLPIQPCFRGGGEGREETHSDWISARHCSRAEREKSAARI